MKAAVVTRFDQPHEIQEVLAPKPDHGEPEVMDLVEQLASARKGTDITHQCLVVSRASSSSSWAVVPE